MQGTKGSSKTDNHIMWLEKVHSLQSRFSNDKHGGPGQKCFIQIVAILVMMLAGTSSDVEPCIQ